MSGQIHAWWLFRRAERYRRREAWRKAAALYRRALAADPADRGARLWLGVCLAETGRFDQAHEMVEGAPLFQARVLYDEGRMDEAQTCAEREENQHGRGLLALCLLRHGRHEEARPLLAALPATGWLLGRALLAIEQLPEPAPTPAEPAPSLETAGRGGRRHIRRGLVYLRNEKWDKALEAFRRARRSLPDHPQVNYGLGLSLSWLNHHEPARERLLAALDRLQEPFRSDAEAALGRIAVELGEPQEAVGRLRRARAAGAVHPQNDYALGLAFLRLGKMVLARRALERCATPEFVRQRLDEKISALSSSSTPRPS